MTNSFCDLNSIKTFVYIQIPKNSFVNFLFNSNLKKGVIQKKKGNGDGHLGPHGALAQDYVTAVFRTK